MKSYRNLDKIICDCYIDFVVPKKISSFGPILKADIYFALKSFCLENLILLTKEQREYCLKGLAKKVKEARKKVGKKVKLKHFKVLVSFDAVSEEDMREKIPTGFETEWWCCCEVEK